MRAPIANLDAMAGFSAPICSAVRSFRVQKKSENTACNTQRWVYVGDMKTKQDKLWVKVGNVAFTCNTIEDAAKRVQLFFQNWYESGLCSPSDQSDWNVWSNRRNKSGGRKHIANIYNGVMQ